MLHIETPSNVNALALSLVLISAILHAAWNLMAKRARGGSLFTWTFTTLSSVVLVPAAVIHMHQKGVELGIVEVACLAGTAALHLVYFITLQAGYRAGDLSLVYPLARGLGPALSTVAAIALFHERPTWLALAGVVMVLCGVAILTIRRRDERSTSHASEDSNHSAKANRHTRAAVVFGVTTGILIAIYTLWDKWAVGTLRLPPLAVEAFTGLGISLMLTPTAMRRWPDVVEQWRRHRWEAIGVAVLAPASYILMLTALATSPVSHVAPMRETSILFGALLGSRLLGEQDSARRWSAAAVMTCGVVALAMG